MSDSPITISEETVRQEGAEIETLAKELAARQDRFLKLVDYLRAIGKEAWVPPSVAITSLAQNVGIRKGPAPADSGTWPSEMLKALEHYPNGIMSADLVEVLRAGSFRGNVEKNPNGIYNATSNLHRSGQIVKHKGRMFLPHHYETYMERVKRGEISDYKGSGSGRTVADMLVDFIAMHDGVEAGDIVEHMVASGHVASAGPVYNNLSKIAMKGRVRREGKIYLPLKNEALPEQSESASQITGSETETSLPNKDPGNE